MTKRINLNEDELRAKRVFTKLERASISAYNYSKKTNKGIKRPIVKNTPYNTPKCQDKVVFKILCQH